MIKANFSAYSKYVTDSLNQWDLNQVLQVTGLNLTTAPEVHFSNANMDRAIVRQSTMTNHVVSVDIPNSLLQDPLRIYAHIGIYEGETFKVVELVEIPVKPRKRPLDYQIDTGDDEVYSFKRLENMLGNAATKAEAKKANDAANARIDNIIANANQTEGNSELVDVRVDIYGKIHTSAGEAIRNELKTATENIKPEKLGAFEPIDLEDVVIPLSADNTELLEGKIYDSLGGLVSGSTGGTDYDTIYFPVGAMKAFTFEKYAIGVYGGAFVDINKKWISSFKTDHPNNLEAKAVPENAGYVAITVKASERYWSITGYRDRYYMNGLKVKSSQVEPDGFEASHWYGKKLGVIGTSVSFGQYADKAYPHEAAKRLGLTLKNFSVPGLALHTAADGSKLTYGSFVLSKAEYAAQGTTIPTAPVDYTPGGSYNDYFRTFENVFTAENADVDLWVYAVTPNNSDFSRSDWDAFDTTAWAYKDGSTFADHRSTFLGALLFVMNKMYELNPNARMVLTLDSLFNYGAGKAAFDQLRNTWNLPVIDLWGNVNTSPKSLTKLKSKDGTDSHPSAFAHEIMGKMLAGHLHTIA